MKNPVLYIVCGKAFSGKSTLSKKIAEKSGAEIVGRDKIYFAIEKMLELENSPEEDDDKLWSKDLWPIAAQGVKNHLLLGRSVVFDDVCLRRWQRDELKGIASVANAETKLIYLDIPESVLRERKERNKTTKERHDVPSTWLEDDEKVFEKPEISENPLVVTDASKFEELLVQI